MKRINELIWLSAERVQVGEVEIEGALLPNPTRGLIILKLSPNTVLAGTIKRLLQARGKGHGDCDKLDTSLPRDRSEPFELTAPLPIEMIGAQERNRTTVDAAYGAVN